LACGAGERGARLRGDRCVDHAAVQRERAAAFLHGGIERGDRHSFTIDQGSLESLRSPGRPVGVRTEAGAAPYGIAALDEAHVHAWVMIRPGEVVAILGRNGATDISQREEASV